MYVTTQGGPQFKTETLVQYIYKTGFNQPYNLGYACALSVLLLVVILAVSLPMYRTCLLTRIRRPGMNEKKKRRVTLLRVVKIVLTVFLIVIVLFPLIWMAVGSFKLEKEILGYPPTVL